MRGLARQRANDFACRMLGVLAVDGAFRRLPAPDPSPYPSPTRGEGTVVELMSSNDKSNGRFSWLSRRPVPSNVKEIAASFGIALTEADAASFAGLLKGVAASYDRLDAMVEPKPEVKYARTTGARPKAEDNRYNAWAWKSTIKGAARGVLAGKTIAVKDNVCVAGAADAQRLARARELRAGCGRHRRHAHPRCRRHHPRQDRVRGPLLFRRQPHLAAAAGEEPAQADPFGRRLLQRQRGGGLRGRGRRRARRRPGRLHPHAGVLDRRLRAQGHARAGALYRRDADRGDARPLRADGGHGGGRGAPADGHRRAGRPRPAADRLQDAGLHGGAEEGREGPEDRGGEGGLRPGRRARRRSTAR